MIYIHLAFGYKQQVYTAIIDLTEQLDQMTIPLWAADCTELTKNAWLFCNG